MVDPTVAEAMRTTLSGMGTGLSTTTAVQRRKVETLVAQLPDSWLWIPIVRESLAPLIGRNVTLLEVTKRKFTDDVVEEGINQTTPTTIRWSPPLNSHIKINFDGSVQGNSTAGEYVFMKHEGKVILSGTKRLPTTEPVTLRDSLVKAKKQGYQNIQVECNSKLVIDVVNGRSSTHWRLLKIIQDIKNIARSFYSISFNPVYREANFVAEAMTHEGHQLPDGHI
ncbi:hypothetical protein ACLB2K_019879 [Fragaria x ananassa]